MEQPHLWQKWHILLFLGFVLALSYLTYFHRYWEPPHVYWDENYHIASAQKYIHGTYFMEQHPPLGKLLVAAGELLIHPNAKTDQFLGTDYGTEFDGISFAGYRFFSALLAWLTAPLFFFLFLRITRNPLLASLLSFFYIFDNALIVHLRGAMLEGPLVFFSVLFMLLFLWLLDEARRLPADRLAGKGRFLKQNRRFLLLSAAFGVTFACIATTKVVGLVFILLLIPLVWAMRKDPKKILLFAAKFGFCFLIVYVAIWQIHFSRGSRINVSLPDNGYYQASQEYKTILLQGTNGSLRNFPMMWRDSIKFISHYNNGAPRLDLCKEDENGSAYTMWPLGARSINYRWETPDGTVYRYLYLQANPAVWWTAFGSVILAFGALVVPIFFPVKQRLRRPDLLLTFGGLYLAYMLAISRIDRVMYLYHYFLPLLFSFVIAGLLLMELQALWKHPVYERERTVIAMVLAFLIFAGYQFYRPFTYYEPMTDAQVTRRAIFPAWELRCVNCEHVSPLVIPTKEPQ